MQAQSQQPVETFTIGFDDELYNEAAHARAVARHLLSAHHGYGTCSDCRADWALCLPCGCEENG